MSIISPGVFQAIYPEVSPETTHKASSATKVSPTIPSEVRPGIYPLIYEVNFSFPPKSSTYVSSGICSVVWVSQSIASVVPWISCGDTPAMHYELSLQTSTGNP